MNTLAKVMLLGVGLFCASCGNSCNSGLESANQKVLSTHIIDLTEGKVITPGSK